ncbi:MAG TPA: glycyl radical protein [bacterium]|nr:glycyl radical protein [bacterium]HPR86933.1 glycyl radical protein [bacterium]
MNERVRLLREASLQAVPTLSTERAEIVTRVYREAGLLSAPALRARVFQAIMTGKQICINPGELIVGERGPAPKATSTFPELCCHSLEDLEILNSREKVFFRVDARSREQYRDEFIPFWRGRSIREMILASMTPEWKEAYTAGIFTEFMEQRGPGHTVLDDKIYHRGMNDFIAEIDARLAALDYINDAAAYDQSEELKAMRLCAASIITFARRHADVAAALAQVEPEPQRRHELEEIATLCRRVPAEKPRTFHEALQYYWFVHLGVITEINPWDAFNPGRLDQHLYPFYKSEIAAGTLTRDKARELLQCFWIKFNNQPAPPKVGVTAAESSTYTDFANINSGGLQADGSDGVNELSYLILDVIDEMRLVQPSSNIQLSRKNPDAFLKHALRIVRKGWGQPSLFNADTVVEEMLRQGKSIEDARQGGTSGCVETGAFGKEAYILTGYFNIPKILELALHDGFDPRTRCQLGPHSGDPAGWRSFDELMAAFEQQMAHFIEIKMAGNAVIERLYALHMPVPFLSLLIDDCIARGRDYNAGGARYNTSYIQGVGIGTITDSLAAIKYQVFEQQQLSLPEFIALLDRNFAGDEAARQRLLNKTPKYGNDDEYADRLMLRVFEMYYALVNGRPNTRGGTYRINLLPTTCHVYFGSVTGATPDGRKAGTPLSEGISPVQGSDRNGPTAVLKSAARMDHVRTGGTLLNQKFTPDVLAGEEGIDHLSGLVRSYFTLGGHHIQFNVVDAATLRHAQAHPEEHRDLIVRVAGYSDYFLDLGQSLQDEIIARTEHQGF